MADLGSVESELGSLPREHKKAFMSVLRYVLKNLTFGSPDERAAKNFKMAWLSATTSSVANTEFSVAHGMDGTPMFVMPALPLNEVGAKIVPLEVSRVADAKRIYLKSSSTSASIKLLAE